MARRAPDGFASQFARWPVWVVPAAAIAFATLVLSPGRWRESSPESAHDGSRAPLETARATDPEASPSASQSSAAEESTFERIDGSATGPGTVRLRAVDDRTGEPIGSLAFVLYTEQEGDRLKARGRTDGSGNALLLGLPLNRTLLVETERRPPHAPRQAALWLDSPSEKRVEIRVGTGGPLRGRVVDDQGTPLANVDVRLSGDPPGLRQHGRLRDAAKPVVGRTQEDGCFEIDALLSRPRGVWVESDRPKPERYEPIRIELVRGVCRASLFSHVREGEAADVGDVLLPRPSRLIGIVVDATGSPVPGVLVSANRDRWSSCRWAVEDARDQESDAAIGPGAPGFHLMEAEALSDPQGRFDVEVSVDLGFGYRELVVWTPSGQIELFPSPILAPGSQSEELTLRIEQRPVVTLDLFDPDGNRIDGRSQEIRERLGTLVESALQRRTLWLGEVLVVAGFDDDRSVVAVGRRNRDGLYPVQLPGEIDALCSLEIEAPGFLPSGLKLNERLRSGQTLRVQLEPIRFHALRLHVSQAASDERPGEDAKRAGAQVKVRACLFAPPRRGDGQARQCCGLGGDGIVRIQPEEVRADLWTRSDSPYWVYLNDLREPDAAAEEPLVFGPFVPGETVHEIRLPAGWAQSETPSRGSSPTWAAEPPAAAARRVNIEVEVRSAATDRPIPRAHVSLKKDPHWRLGISDLNGVARVALPEGGTWTARISDSQHYRTRELTLEVDAHGHTRFGPIRLERLDVVSGRVLEADGSPAQAVFVSFYESSDPEGWRWFSRPVDADGSFEHELSLREHRVEGCIVSRPLIEGAGMDGVAAHQRFRVEDPSMPLEIRLDPWCAVEVRVTGLPEDRLQHPLRLEARRIDVPDATAQRDARDGRFVPNSSDPSIELAHGGDGARRYRFLITPGLYRIEGSNGLVAVASDIHVEPSRETARFEVVASSER
jgi:hypothetical protein